jgi:glycosyltransferase involved in cell wall biosynthesis
MQAILFGSAGFAGSARIMADCAAVMSTLVDRVHLVTQSDAFHAKVMPPSVTRSTSRTVVSDAIVEGGPLTSSDSIMGLTLAEEIIASATDADVILWAHYLFPFLPAGLIAKAALTRLGFQCRLWVTPAGSDIWQITPQIPVATSACLASGEIDQVLTYSNAFAREIEQISSLLPGSVQVFTPCVSQNVRPRSYEKYAQARVAMGIASDALVMTNHSNMRPVKAVDDVIRLARDVAQERGTQETWLLLAGPPKPVDAPLEPLRFRHLGLINAIDAILDPSDVEVNLSRHDSFNLSIAEAMTVGVPTVTTKVAGVAQHVANSNSGLVVELETEASCKQRYGGAKEWICHLGSSDVRARFQLGQQAASYAATHFSREQLTARLANLLRAN